MKLKHLESALSSIQREFPNPNVSLEQYPTCPHLAAAVILNALEREDVGPGRTVLDLGCGTGILALACALVESDFVYGVDCDEGALAIARENIVELELSECIALVHGVVGDGGNVPNTFTETIKRNSRKPRGKSKGGVPPPCSDRVTTTPEARNVFPFRHNAVDTVICNPPFGTKRAGIDIEFLNLACAIATRTVYSFHKTSTRSFVLKQARGAATVVAEMRFDIPRSYEFHKRDTIDVAVDLIRVDLTTTGCSDE